MKKTGIVLLAVLLLMSMIACQPTPTEEFVVNKKDSGAAAKLQADTDEGAESRGPQRAPDRWDEVYESDLMTLTFAAPITQKADGLYPVYRTRSNPLTEAEMVNYLNALFPDPVAVRRNLPTKADIQREMEWYLQEAEAKLAWQDAGRPDDGVDQDETPLTREEVDQELANYQALIQNAPETNEESPTATYHIPTGQEGILVYRLASGDSLIVNPSWEGSLYAGLGSNHTHVYPRYEYEEMKRFDDEDTLPYTPVAADQKKCEQAAKDALAKLGIEGMVLAATEEANLMDGRVCLAGGYECLFVRDFGGYPYLGSNFEPAQGLTYGSDSSFVANKHIRAEELRLFADEAGVKLISFDAPKMIVGIESKNAELLPFDKAQERIRQGLVYGLTKWAQELKQNEPDLKLNVEIYKIGITSYTIHAPNSEDYCEMPCYVVYYDPWQRPDSSRNDKTMMQETLLINAVDGSIVHTDYGY
ncbi:MAG: hypothetical protein IJQ45_07540 [Clostridia bacterium]|nr:hypothetical protein [Clostridia bacterium]